MDKRFREFPGWGTVEVIEDPNHKGIMSQDFYTKPITVKEPELETKLTVPDEEVGCCGFLKERKKKSKKTEQLGQWL
jgi:hypothetical protein